MSKIAAPRVSHTAQTLPQRDGLANRNRNIHGVKVRVPRVQRVAVRHHHVVAPSTTAFTKALVGRKDGALWAPETNVHNSPGGCSLDVDGRCGCVVVDVIGSFMRCRFSGTTSKGVGRRVHGWPLPGGAVPAGWKGFAANDLDRRGFRFLRGVRRASQRGLRGLKRGRLIGAIRHSARSGKNWQKRDDWRNAIHCRTILIMSFHSAGHSGETETPWQAPQTAVDFQEIVAAILRAMGYKTRVAGDGPDRGVDIFASPDGLGLQEPRIFVAVKHRNGQMGAPAIRSFLGGREPGDRCLYVSTKLNDRMCRWPLLGSLNSGSSCLTTTTGLTLKDARSYRSSGFTRPRSELEASSGPVPVPTRTFERRSHRL